MLKHTSPIAIALIALAGAASADGLTYGSAKASYLDLDGVDLKALSGDFDYVTGNLSFTGSAGPASIEGVDFNTLGLTAGYAIVPGLTVYASLAYLDVEIGGASGDTTSYGLGVEYQTADYGVALDYTTNDDTDIDIVTLAGYYTLGQSTIYGSYSDVDSYGLYTLGYALETSAYEFDIASMWGEDGLDSGATALSVRYNVTNAITLGASAMTLNDNLFDYGIATIGGAYHFNEAVSLEADYVTAFGDGFDGDGFRLALKWETGTRRLRVMDQINHYAKDTTPFYDFASDLMAGL